MEGSDEIFPQWAVHSRLPPDGAVHLGNDGGRKLNHGNAPVVDGGDESREIANDASAKCKDGALAVKAELNESVAEVRRHGHRLGGLTRWYAQQVGIKTGGLE